MANLATIQDNILADSGIDPINLIVGTGTINYIPVFTAEGSIGNSIMTQSGSNILISSNIVLHAGNFNSYAPTLTGGGASGTWGINISGNASTATNANNADTVDGLHASAFALTGGSNATGTWPISVTGTSGYANSAGTAGLVTGTSGGAIQAWDIRTIAPSSMTSGRLGFGFTSWNNDNTAPWADYLHLRSYTDGSGGNDNLVMFLKNGIGMRIYQQAWGSSAPYVTYVDMLDSGNFNTWAPTLTGGGASGTWAISITGNANTLDGYDASAFALTGGSNATGIWPIGITGSWNALNFNGVFARFTGDINSLGLSGTSGIYNIGTGYTNGPAADLYGALFGIWNYDISVQFWASYNGDFYWRKSIGNSYVGATWRTLLDSSNYNQYAVQATSQLNWNSYNVIANVVGLLAWKNYGNQHVIFDASQSTSPSGTGVSSTDPQAAWAPTYPTLMGWNGSMTYGVRVDSARLADSAGSASSVPWSGVTGKPTTLAGYGITDAVPSSRTLTINGVTYDLSANRTWTIAAGVTSIIAGTGISVNQAQGDVTISNTGVLSVNGGTGAITGIATTAQLANYLPLAGGTMSGSIAMGGNNITNVSQLSHANGRIILTGNLHIDAFNGNAIYLQYYNQGVTTRIYGDIDMQNYNTTNVNIGYANNSFRAPIFYDSNDTTFYVDPNSLSNLYTLRVGNGAEVPGLIGMGASFLYGMGVSGAYTAVHAHPSANGVALGSYDGSTFTRKFYVNNDGNAYAITGMYAPVFYDLNDTSYYINPNGTSIVNTISGVNMRVSNAYYWGSGNVYMNYNGTTLNTNVAITSDTYMSAPLYYDSDNGAFYGNFAGTSRFNITQINSVVDQNYYRITNPEGGINVNSGPLTGAIKIKLPPAASFINVMMSLTVQIYNYQTGTSRTIRCGGYNYFDGSWYNVFAYQIGDNGTDTLNVRFGVDGTSNCIWIGETSTYWSYPNVFITDIQAGHSQSSFMAYGWNVSFVTAFDTVQTNREAYFQINAGNIASQSVSYAANAGNANTLDGYDSTYFVPTARTLTINGVTYDLSANRSWTIASGGVNSIIAGTGISVNQAQGDVTISNTGVLSINGSTGAVTGIATTAQLAGYLPLTGGTLSGALTINGIWETNISTTGGWSKLSFTASNAWGDGTTYGTLGASGGNEPGVMIYNMHATWAGSGQGAGIRMGRSGGVASGAWYQVATMDSNEFMIAKNGQWANGGIKITDGGVLYYGNTGYRYIWENGTWGINISGVASQVTINYNNDSNSTYQMLWGSGNSVYGTSGIYVNPYTDTIYASAYRGNANVAGTGEAIYTPAGIYSTGNNWLYGSLFMAGNNMADIGGITQNQIMGRPNLQWGAGGSSTGAVIIKFPGDTNNYGMVHAVIDIYEYNGNNVSTIIVGGHNWGSQWYSYGANVVGYTNKQVRVGVKDGKYCIIIGDGSSTWSYGQVVLRKIQNGAYYSGVMNVGSGYTIGIESDTYSWVSGDLRTFRSSGSMYMNEQLVATQSWVNSQGFVTGGPFLPLSGGTVTGTTNFNASVNFASETRWFGGYGPGSGPGIALENISTFARFAFWGLDFYDWNHGIQMTLDNGYVSVNNYLQAGNSLRAPIFYDSNDTTYYLDPNSTSNLWDMRLLNGKWYTVNNNSGNSVDIYVRPNADNTYVWRHIYGGSGTGYGTGPGGYGIYNQTLGGDYSAIFSSSGYVVFPYSARSPIFYDSQDTAYYLDPNSGSNLYSVITVETKARKNQSDNNYTTAALWTESYGGTTTGIAFHISGNVGKFLEMRTNGVLYWENNTVITSGNYNSYSPTLTGGNASGTWGISITGNANYASTSNYANTSGTAQGLSIVGYGNGTQTYYQTPGTFAGYTGWASYLISSHGDGATYYNQTIIMPFWGAPQYSRLEGGVFKGPYIFVTTENSPYAYNMNQYVRTTDSPTFTAAISVNADGSTGYVASRIWLYSHNNYRGAGTYMSGTGSTWFAGTPYTDFDGVYMIGRRGVAGAPDAADLSYRLWQVSSSGNTFQTGSITAAGGSMTGAFISNATNQNFTNFTARNTSTGTSMPNQLYYYIEARYNNGSNGTNVYHWVRDSWEYNITNNYHDITFGATYSGASYSKLLIVSADGNIYATNSFRAPVFYDSADSTYYVDPNGGSYLRGRVDVTGGHYNSSLRVLLRADENGSGSGQSSLTNDGFLSRESLGNGEDLGTM